MLSHSRFLTTIQHPLSLAVLSGLMLALPQAVPFVWWLVFPGVALMILAAIRTNSLKQVLLIGFVVGTMKCLGGYSWIWSTFPLSWVDIDSLWVHVFLIAAFWVTSSAFMGVGMIVPALVTRYFYLRTFVFLLVFPLAWVVGEVVGSFSASLWFLGDGSFINGYMAHGYLGIPLSQLLFLSPIMSVAGVYGLTYVAALLGALIALASTKQKLSNCLIIVVIFLLVVAFIFFPRSVEPLGIKVISIDTWFTSASQSTESGRELKKQAVSQAVLSALQDSEGEYPDIILLPEDSRFTTQFDSPEEALQYLQELAPEAGTLLVDTARVDRNDGTAVLRAFYYDLEADDIYMTDKQFLVPQGEYVTYPFHFLLSVFQPETMERLNRNQNYVPGPLSSYEEFPSDIPAMAFCFESSLTMGVMEVLKQQNTKLVLHPISHGKFTDPHILWYQLDALLRTQAIWGKVNVVTAGNMHDSRVYRSNGLIEEGEVIVGTPTWQAIQYVI